MDIFTKPDLYIGIRLEHKILVRMLVESQSWEAIRVYLKLNTERQARELRDDLLKMFGRPRWDYVVWLFAEKGWVRQGFWEFGPPFKDVLKELV